MIRLSGWLVWHRITLFLNHHTGQQEYSSRQAGITFGIVLAVIIPIVMLLVYGGYKILQKRKAHMEEDDNQDVLYDEHLRFV